MTTTPTAIAYEDALKIARAELKRIWDHIEENRPDEDENGDSFERLMDVSHGMWMQITWTLAQVYGLEYEEVEGDLDCNL
ncbi:MAG: hypothetical protein IJO87_02320 [Eggerthellaceae bacterium]|nr:hypothetical protein [Eggerthellaceae bacterium]